MQGSPHPPPAALPVAILGGSDLVASQLPPAGAGQHPLAAYKGAEILVDGRPLAALLAERLRACPEVGEVWVVGPARVYGPLGFADAIVDTDLDLGGNLRATVDFFRARRAAGPLAFLACDVLPTVDELRAVFARWRAEADASAVWFPLVRVPADPQQLAAFAWKPEYRLREREGAAPTWILPGHLMIADPRAMRMRMLYGVLQAAYRTRNRPIEKRRGPMARAVLAQLLWSDLLHLLALRAPTLTWTVLTRGLRMARLLRAGDVTVAELERLGGDICLKTRYRRAHPRRGARLPLVDALGLAEDVDTEEEAADLARAARLRNASRS